MTPFATILSLPVRAYRMVFSPWIGFNCRYQPTCSAYALEALEKHGAIKGAYLAARRIGRCHPLGASGYDPVPDTKTPPKHTTSED
ncbi:membrane protein insertion efficiency factor YidD [Pacificibacter marinus]|uniref:membrane protein insertion efficiency factor YidD n=1 Tax=Pacificibacter marinus TaxID=658057 RepID=UPI001C0743D2|nr:membrane protein insertion efficiency factor YidD [Pacificibacter marinus]MBU2865696.1 membrane protein insertion efficiency factor YidD [Pacificibacter marinus]